MAKNAKKITAATLAVLATIVAAGENGTFVAPADSKPLLDAGYVDVNPSMTEGDKLATRATAAGIAFNGEQTGPAAGATSPGAEAAKPKQSFEIESGIPIPETVRAGSGRTEMYPISTLQVGTSFFVPGKEAAQLGSTLTAARNRFAEVIEGQTRVTRSGKTVPLTKVTREFVAKNDTKNGVAGARVWRTV